MPIYRGLLYTSGKNDCVIINEIKYILYKIKII